GADAFDLAVFHEHDSILNRRPGHGVDRFALHGEVLSIRRCCPKGQCNQKEGREVAFHQNSPSLWKWYSPRNTRCPPVWNFRCSGLERSNTSLPSIQVSSTWVYTLKGSPLSRIKSASLPGSRDPTRLSRSSMRAPAMVSDSS